MSRITNDMSEQKDPRVVDYQSTVKSVALCAQLLQQFDLPKLLEEMEHADAVGPLFNPTLWMQKHTAMDQDRRLIEAALPLWKKGKELAELATMTTDARASVDDE